MAADLARDVAAMARAARDDRDGHEGLIRQLEHLQPRIDGILARVNDDGSDQNANDLRRWVVVLVTRIAAAAHAEAPRGADVVELVGAAHAPQAVVLAFDELEGELERWAVCLEDLTLPTAYYLNDEDDDAHLFDDEEDDGAVSDADFEGDSLKARAKKAWAATPPVTQVYVGSSLALTLGSFFLAGNQWPSWLNLDWKKVMTGQLWFPSGVSYPFVFGQ